MADDPTPETHDSKLRARLRALLFDARRDRDVAVAAVVRSVLDELENAEAAAAQEEQELAVAQAGLDAVAVTLEQLARADSARAAEQAHAVQVVRDVLRRQGR